MKPFFPSNPDITTIFIGGHYSFPNIPSLFAINSIALSDALFKQQKANTELIAFVNDIKASNFCNQGVCNLSNSTKNVSTNKVQNLKSVNDILTVDFLSLEELDNLYSIKLSNEIINLLFGIYISNENIDFSKVTSLKILLNLHATIELNTNHCKISALFYLLHGIDAYLENLESERFFYALDYLAYLFFKDKFHPIEYTKKNIKSNVVFEKTIYNFSSKLIRKLQKQNALKGLIIENRQTEYLYKFINFSGGEVILRKEIVDDNYFNATNTCPLIIATLYYKLVIDSKEKDKIAIIYQIPSHDRNKVNIGTECFFNLFFPYLQDKYHVKEVTIYNCYWLSDNTEHIICDKFTPNEKQTFILNKHELN